MKRRYRSTLIWILVSLFTLAIAYYQRKTGPTYPLNKTVTIENKEYDYALLRSKGGKEPAIIKITVPDTSIHGIYKFKRINHPEDWSLQQMERDGDELLIILPPQPPAGKLRYQASLIHKGKTYSLTEAPVVIRFKGSVPLCFLLPHVIIMFVAMLFSTRTGVEALIKGEKTYIYTKLTVVLFFAGGLILGPVVQKYAFGSFWAGWPFGQDLTDNKTLLAFVFWLIALLRQRKNRKRTGWAVVASVVLLLVYLIPHSMFGSELDYSTGTIGTGNK